MKYRDFFSMTFICFVFNVASAQCYIQYTYNAFGHRIKHEYVGEDVADRAQSGYEIAQSISGSGNTCCVGIVVSSRAYTTTISANGNTVVPNNWGFGQYLLHKI